MAGRRQGFLLLLLLLLLLVPLSGCKGGTPGEEARRSPEPTGIEATPPAITGDPGIEAIQLGVWTEYARVTGSDWETRPLTLARWSVISAELACAGRALQGNPEEHRAATDRILQHHQTKAEDVMSFSVRLNTDPEQALLLGALVAEAAERCR